ncbi:MAG TPA: deoxyribose-phosphate aldolase [Baekduia sp.]|nr:deoxyribose-phosphate aldolase [Baekduia sp.]
MSVAALVALLDLTSLDADDTAADVRVLCARTRTPLGPVAAVCVIPRLVDVAAAELGDGPVRVATVVDFPAGTGGPDRAAAEVRAAVAAGADELDVVVPWRAHLAGDGEAVGTVVRACVAAAGGRPVKAILETGSHPDPAATRAMADAALDAGAAFLKTSTGTAGPGASPEVVRVLLEAVREHGRGGVKVSGGVRTVAQARAYAQLAEDVLGPGRARPSTFRIGASGLLDALLAADA